MKTITLTQPWASLVSLGAKRIETRSWKTTYRGPLAIHAASGFPKWARELVETSATFQHPLQEALDLDGSPGQILAMLPRGKVVAICRLTDCIPVEQVKARYPQLWGHQEHAFGDYSPGRWAWILENVEPLDEPAPAKGALSLWEWCPPDGQKGGTP